MHESSPLKSIDTGRSNASEDTALTFTPSPRTIDDSATNVETAGGYFDLRQTGPRSPGSVSDVVSLGMSSLSTSAAAALTALQYLPVPVLVLSAKKTVVMGNDAMGRLLGVNTEASIETGGPLSTSEGLQGQAVGQLGIDILQGSSPIWMNWEVSPLIQVISVSVSRGDPLVPFCST